MKQQIWAPWRINYILKKKPKGCIFCQKLKEYKDKENYILQRSTKSFSILNLYPYNNGHLMVVPFRHIGDFEHLENEELADMMKIVSDSTKALKKALNPDGFNVGANIGRVAGAGIADHIHIHVVPRWTADTNFMPVLADTNVISEGLNDTYDKLKKALG